MRDYIPCSIPSSPSPEGAHLVGELRDKECETGKDNAKTVVRVSRVCALHHPHPAPILPPLTLTLILQTELGETLGAVPVLGRQDGTAANVLLGLPRSRRRQERHRGECHHLTCH